MKYPAWLVVLFVLAAGVTGVAFPDRLIGLRGPAASQAGLLGFAVLASAVGIVLIMAAPASRVPKTLQAAGAAFLFAGMATPFVGVERTRALLDWAAAQGPWLVRAWGAVVLAAGAFLVFSLRPRAARHAP